MSTRNERLPDPSLYSIVLPAPSAAPHACPLDSYHRRAPLLRIAIRSAPNPPPWPFLSARRAAALDFARQARENELLLRSPNRSSRSNYMCQEKTARRSSEVSGVSQYWKRMIRSLVRLW
ncbi:hypothetical protein BKA80DRAFT_9725 [Phyllosticta citrichinensis]